jgi:hypothetical protein
MQAVSDLFPMSSFTGTFGLVDKEELVRLWSSNSPQWAQNYILPISVIFFVTLALIYSLFRTRSLDLPTFQVTSDVLQTIEDGHAKV